MDIRRKIMATLTFSARGPETIERRPWTSQEWHEVFVFLVWAAGTMCVAVFLYSPGPALGMAVVVGSLVAWWKVANYCASTRADEGGEHDGTPFSVDTPFRCAGTARLKTDRRSVSTAMASRPIFQQSA